VIIILAIGVAVGCVYALVAVGYSLVYRTTGVVNFAQGSYVMLGGFSAYWFLTNARLPYAVAIVLGVAVASLAGLLLWTLIVLPLWRRRSPAFVVILATIVVGAILANVALILLGTTPRTLPPWIPRFGLGIAGNRVDGQYLVVFAATLFLMALFGAVLRFTILGKAMRACAANRDVAQLLGISAERIGAIAFTTTAAVGGLGGAMITPAQFTAPEAGLAYGVYGFVAAVLGGFGSLAGALVGGLLLGLLQALVGRYISSNFETVIVFAVLLVLLTVRPQGIIGMQWEES
jgi:branched-chain amino acid transport system permease protein